MKTSLIRVLSTITAVSVMGVGAAGAHDHGAQCDHGHAVTAPHEKASASTEQKEVDTGSTKTLAPQTTCPVMDGTAINKKFSADHEGKRVYFCCKKCVTAFKKDPAKYLDKLESMGQTAEEIAPPAKSKADKTTLAPQTTCPVMGGKIDKKQFVDVNGRRIYVCCAGCIATIEKNPDKYIRKLESSGQMAEVIAD